LNKSTEGGRKREEIIAANVVAELKIVNFDYLKGIKFRGF